MANNTRKILIESILGGQGKISNFSAADEFRACAGIDPSLQLLPNTDYPGPPSGLINPSYYALSLNSALTSKFDSRMSVPIWIKAANKTTTTFVYGYSGSMYTRPYSGTSFEFSDGGSLSNSTGNGMAYYDNYLYLAKNTTVARFGPLDGDAVLNGDYWVGTLGKQELINTAYPTFQFQTHASNLPNHVLHRHSDGKLYMADVVGGQGAIHYIATTKTSKEGDTDNGSTANKLVFGYGLYPTAIESYGSDLVIALFESNLASGDTQLRVRSEVAKLAFWDTTSQNYNTIIFTEFPDSIITALKNINGTLYIVSCSNSYQGFRVSRYIGGTSIEEVRYFEYGAAPSQGGVDGNANRLVFGSSTRFPRDPIGGLVERGCVYSLGLQNSALGQGMFITGLTSTTNASSVSALCINGTSLSAQGQSPIIGWSGGTGGFLEDPSYYGGGYSSNPLWQSQVFKIGSPFKITKIKIPITYPLDSNTFIVPTVFLDENDQDPKTLTTISSANYSTNTRLITIRPVNLTGDYSFYLQLSWMPIGVSYTAVGLPITIEYELLDVDAAHP